ncbi:MAG: hypothetical protein COV75_00380 [Candidatus Omnitrophica bacterium CG11_big_fil_rev_8_21_14_0_20_63_9]|nr:MAG: hypothetical protein COV75_00380 [Candidatus Omnitrophica bacterium CG11_big_fil_rev_8_21_14_0_20_63_9]
MLARVASDTVRYTSDGAMIEAFFTEPAYATGPSSAILLLHEWWGLTERVKSLAKRLANEGFVTLAPNLYARLGGKTAATAQEASALMSKVSSQATLRDLNAAIQWLKQQPQVDPLRLGSIGFSMGATFALTQAIHNSDLKAVVAFYGKTPPVESLPRLLRPVLFIHAGKDAWVNKLEVDQFREGLAKNGKPADIVSYANCDHGFFNESQPEYHREAAEDAWRRTLEFLRTHLR